MKVEWKSCISKSTQEGYLCVLERVVHFPKEPEEGSCLSPLNSRSFKWGGYLRKIMPENFFFDIRRFNNVKILMNDIIKISDTDWIAKTKYSVLTNYENDPLQFLKLLDTNSKFKECFTRQYQRFLFQCYCNNILTFDFDPACVFWKDVSKFPVKITYNKEDSVQSEEFLFLFFGEPKFSVWDSITFPMILKKDEKNQEWERKVKSTNFSTNKGVSEILYLMKSRKFFKSQPFSNTCFLEDIFKQNPINLVKVL
jgi:hypothetical protein